MEFPNIDPVFIELGPIKVHWYGMMYLIAFVTASWLASRAASKPNSGWTKEQTSDLLFYGMIGVILGGRFGYVLFYQFSYFLENPLYLLKIWEGGMSFHGGVIGVITAIAWFAKKQNKTLFGVGDFVAPLVPLGLFFGRIGNFINGELWGRASDVPWAMVFPTGGPVARHPSQLYEGILEGLVLFAVIQLVNKKPRPEGVIGGLFLFGYGFFRFIVEYFREPDAHIGLYGNVISQGQILSLPMILGGLGLIVWAYKRQQKECTA